MALHVEAVSSDRPADNAATVYYSTEKNWASYRLHYAPVGGAWTTAPGVVMEAACAGWVKRTVLLGAATSLKAAFNNGSGTWDNNNAANYALGTGDVTVRGGVASIGNPCAGGQTGPGASFSVNATTVPGQSIHVVGAIPALGSWSPVAAPRLDPGSYPVWKLDMALPAGTAFTYKDAAGNVTWESGANRTGAVPAQGTVTLTDTWRD
ncbi:carbohydrate binding domain-containing protein [Streptomyces thermolilacinus]|uniref:carbohydrate binding domain-containing protein n=1 Tax=Streptomyces thermolilacinus TaxID=285540 RepID=UPI0033F753D4